MTLRTACSTDWTLCAQNLGYEPILSSSLSENIRDDGCIWILIHFLQARTYREEHLQVFIPLFEEESRRAGRISAFQPIAWLLSTGPPV